MSLTECNMRKINILMLGTSDVNLSGHVASKYKSLPACYEGCFVTLSGKQPKGEHALFEENSWRLNFFNSFRRKISRIRRMMYGIFKPLRWNMDEVYHYYYDDELMPISAASILNRCPKNFVPDIISVHWSAKFINSTVLRELHERTGAIILFCFVDQAPLTGGCHFPADCDNYITGCKTCPALASGSSYSQIQFKIKQKNLSDLPLFITGTPADMELAKKSPLFKNAIIFPSVTKPELIISDRAEARKFFGINDDFYVFIAANKVDDPRKGFIYSIEGAIKANKQCGNIKILMAGNNIKSIKDKYAQDIEIVDIGFVNYEVLNKAFCACDCFINTPIADSGPMMVNISIGLGTPVVSFDVGIARDLVIHKQTGYISDFKSSDSVKNGILYLYKKSIEQRHEMCENCKAVFEEKTSMNNSFENIAQYIYKKILN